ncbi:hypothetical protein JKA74_02070 [Marivirga sp. S37H4]|uniref:Uncharacterized protein n=1 Tax=Marivirga aurantiaca TaxID=2802615 RepID=A0A934WVH7_9BACT|nr:hypothetical protein [Marivirga aurantiaca]MBK6263808.1 hypothetical protein [Marivirga aurantiaca]
MTNYSPRQQLSTLKIIHFGLLAFPVFATIFFLFNNESSSEKVENELEVLQFIPTIFLLLVFFISGKLFNTTYKNSIGPNPSLQKKMSAFSSAHIVQMALYEGVGLFAVVVSFITGSIYNIGLVALIFLIFLSKTPSIVKLEDKLNLTPEEREQFN